MSMDNLTKSPEVMFAHHRDNYTLEILVISCHSRIVEDFPLSNRTQQYYLDGAFCSHAILFSSRPTCALSDTLTQLSLPAINQD